MVAIDNASHLPAGCPGCGRDTVGKSQRAEARQIPSLRLSRRVEASSEPAVRPLMHTIIFPQAAGQEGVQQNAEQDVVSHLASLLSRYMFPKSRPSLFSKAGEVCSSIQLAGLCLRWR